mgnify:CR=1 FL=1
MGKYKKQRNGVNSKYYTPKEYYVIEMKSQHKADLVFVIALLIGGILIALALIIP